MIKRVAMAIALARISRASIVIPRAAKAAAQLQGYYATNRGAPVC